MIRFCDKVIYSVAYGDITRSELLHYFLKGHRDELICVMDGEEYLGIISYASLIKSSDLQECIQREHAVLDETVWEASHKYFACHKSMLGEVVQLPVLNREGQLLCFAYQDEEADREIRMLHELADCKDALGFKDLRPEYDGVTIHGFNELAWEMAGYLTKQGIPVNTEGELWQEMYFKGSYAILDYKNYEIWAEGIQRKSGRLDEERLRSVSVEFECVDEIYEINVKAGKIVDAEWDFETLINKLKREKEIIIVGKSTKAQDGYDLLLANDVDICAFCAWDEGYAGRKLFGKPVLSLDKIEELYHAPVFIECDSKHSVWGFGGVDIYDYAGYKRNRQYFLLRDYIEIPGNNLEKALEKSKLILVGDPCLCSRVYAWWKKNGIDRIGYWDILEENEEEMKKLQMSQAYRADVTDEDICLLVLPQYNSNLRYRSEEAKNKNEIYIKKLEEQNIHNYTDYFSYIYKNIHLEYNEKKYEKEELRPAGILLGAVPGYSGNMLLRQCLEGHPYIMMIQEYGFFNDNLYLICVRLAEKDSEEILPSFWKVLGGESISEGPLTDHSRRNMFTRKMAELLRLGNRFTSQELFVMFHVAYEAMFGREIVNLNNMVIYWEPHQYDREWVREWAYWLEDKNVQGYTLSTVRNRYMVLGSAIKDYSHEEGLWMKYFALLCSLDHEVRYKKEYEYWDEFTVKFENLKLHPKEEFMMICDKLGIEFQDSLLETTYHGKQMKNKGMHGFDLKPVYNLYEEYFSVFDRMRISLMAASFQKKYGYPYISCLDFTRRELQEMFLKEWRWEKLFPGHIIGKDELVMEHVSWMVRAWLWKVRVEEVMDIDIYGEYNL